MCADSLQQSEARVHSFFFFFLGGGRERYSLHESHMCKTIAITVAWATLCSLNLSSMQVVLSIHADSLEAIANGGDAEWYAAY